MRVYLKLVSALLIVATLCASLFSCKMDIDAENESNAESYYGSDNSSLENGDNKNDNDNNSNSKETQKIPNNAYVLFQGGKYAIKAIMPDKPTDIENTVYAKLRSKIKSKTGSTLSTNTDYLKSGEKHSSSDPEILVGLTNYSESQNIYKDITNGTYGIKISGKKIVFYFSTVEEGLELVDEFCSAIKSNKDKAFWVASNFSVKKTLAFKREDIPAYPTSTSSHDCADDTKMLLAKNTNLDKFKEYCKTLVEEGFVEYSKRDNVNGNYFYTYTKGTMALTVYFNKSNNTVRIISGPLTDIPSKDTTSAKEINQKPSVTLLNQGTKKDGVTQQGSGLGMIFHLPNGKFIIYDGGYTANDGLYKKLQDLAGGNEIIIAAWIISHPHTDHEDAFDAFLKNHAKDIEIETVMYNFANMSDTYGTSETIKGYVNEYLDGKTTIIKPHTGQIYKFGSSTVEILHTVEDFLPNTIKDLNHVTMVVRVTVSGTSTILLGDAYDDVAPFLTNTFGSHLKSDMVQLAHHGTYPGTETLYSKINAPVLFWPSSADNVKNRYNSSGHESLRKAISIAKDVYLASEGTVTLTLPHTLANNKSAFLKRMGLG